MVVRAFNYGDEPVVVREAVVLLSPPIALRLCEAAAADGKEADSKNLVEKDGGELLLSEEAQRTRARGIPTMQLLAEHQHHQLLHLPYRSWCKPCVNSRRREDVHKRQENCEKLATRVWLDCTFVNMGQQILTMLCLEDETSGSVENIAVLEKGAED